MSVSATGRKYFSLFREILAQKNVLNDVPTVMQSVLCLILYSVMSSEDPKDKHSGSR